MTTRKLLHRLICDFAMGDEEEKKLEVMIMVELDDEEKWVSAWELICPYLG